MDIRSAEAMLNIDQHSHSKEIRSFLVARLLDAIHFQDTEFMRIVRQSVSISVLLLLIAAMLLLLTMLPWPAYQNFLARNLWANLAWWSPGYYR